MQNESSQLADKLNSDTRVRRDNGFSERDNNFFLSWLNGASLETLIDLYPGEGDIKFPLKCPHLWYFTREYKIEGSLQFGFKDPLKVIIFNNEEDRRLALEKFPNLFQKTAVRGDEICSSIEKNMEIWRNRHIEIFNFYILNGQFFLSDIRNTLTKYEKLIKHYLKDNGQIELVLQNPDKNSLLEWIEVNFILRTAIEPEKIILSGFRRCEYCKRYYFASSNKAEYCSTNCRVKEFRRRKKSLASEN